MVSPFKLAIAASILTTAFASPLDFVKEFSLVPGEKPVPGDSPVSVCDCQSPQILEMQELTLSPNPPARGANLTIDAKGFLSEGVKEGAYVEVDVRYGYIRLLHQTYDLCEQLSNVDMECPLSKGEYIITKQVEIPQEVPPGKYVVYARAYTADDDYIACLTGSVEFPAKYLMDDLQ